MQCIVTYATVMYS